MKPVLYIFSGLPGTGKSTLAKEISRIHKAAYFRIDTIEQGLRDICLINVQGEGYRLTHRIVKDNLETGNDAVVDCCNPWELTRNEWEDVAIQSNSNYINIEIVCSSADEHKRRINERISEIEGLQLPTWEEIKKREYHDWKKEIIRIDTANKKNSECINELIMKIKGVQSG
jgi:predicted kinase